MASYTLDDIELMRTEHDVIGLMSAVTAGGDARVRVRAIEVLAQMNSSDAVETIVEALHDPDADIRSAAMKALEQIREGEARESERKVMQAVTTVEYLSPDMETIQHVFLLHPENRAFLQGESRQLARSVFNWRNSPITPIAGIVATLSIGALSGFVAAMFVFIAMLFFMIFGFAQIRARLRALEQSGVIYIGYVVQSNQNSWFWLDKFTDVEYRVLSPTGLELTGKGSGPGQLRAGKPVLPPPNTRVAILYGNDQSCCIL